MPVVGKVRKELENKELEVYYGILKEAIENDIAGMEKFAKELM